MLESTKIRQRRKLKKRQERETNDKTYHEIRLDILDIVENKLSVCDKVMVEVSKKDLAIFTSILQDGSFPWLQSRKVEACLFELWTEDLMEV